jgi:hypothetical protein
MAGNFTSEDQVTIPGAVVELGLAEDPSRELVTPKAADVG